MSLGVIWFGIDSSSIFEFEFEFEFEFDLVLVLVLTRSSDQESESEFEGSWEISFEVSNIERHVW